MRLLNLSLELIGMWISLKPIREYYNAKRDYKDYKEAVEAFVSALEDEKCNTDKMMKGMTIRLTAAKLQAGLGVIAFLVMLVILICTL